MEDKVRERLSGAALRLSEHDRVREVLLAERDEALVEALAAGVSWKEAGELAGLTPRSIQLAVKRVEGAQVD